MHTPWVTPKLLALRNFMNSAGDGAIACGAASRYLWLTSDELKTS
jgi:hypothetical protein